MRVLPYRFDGRQRWRLTNVSNDDNDDVFNDVTARTSRTVAVSVGVNGTQNGRRTCSSWTTQTDLIGRFNTDVCFLGIA